MRLTNRDLICQPLPFLCSKTLMPSTGCTHQSLPGPRLTRNAAFLVKIFLKFYCKLSMEYPVDFKKQCLKYFKTYYETNIKYCFLKTFLHMATTDTRAPASADCDTGLGGPATTGRAPSLHKLITGGQKKRISKAFTKPLASLTFNVCIYYALHLSYVCHILTRIK